MKEPMNLDQLFQAAREQAPEQSYQETKQRFLQTIFLTAGGVLATKGILKLFATKKWIMITSLLTVGTGAVVVSAVYTTSGELTQNTNGEGYPTTEITEIVPKTLTDSVVSQENYQEAKEITAEDIENLNYQEIKPIQLYPAPAPLMTVSPPDTVKKVEKVIRKEFRIHKYTSKAELEEMQASAESAGISFSYDYKNNGDEIVKLRISMELSQDGNRQKVVTSTDFEENDTIQLNWQINDNGQALNISAGDCTKERHLHKEDCDNWRVEFDREMEELNEEIAEIEEMDFSDWGDFEFDFDFDFNGLDSLDGPIIEATERALEQLRKDMRLLSEKLEKLETEEVREEIRESRKEIQEELKEVIEEMEEEIKEMREELERKKEEQKRKEEELKN